MENLRTSDVLRPRADYHATRMFLAKPEIFSNVSLIEGQPLQACRSDRNYEVWKDGLGFASVSKG